MINTVNNVDQAPKYTGEDLASITSTCFKLNSLQLKALLVKYQPALDEPRLPHELIDNVVRVRLLFHDTRAYYTIVAN